MNLHFLAGLALLVAGQTAPVETAAPAVLPPSEVKAAFLKLLDRPKVRARRPRGEPEDRGGLDDGAAQLRLREEGRRHDRAGAGAGDPARSEGRRRPRPAVIVLHGTGGNKDGMQSWLVELAKRGIIGVAIDARYHGGRAGGCQGATAYNEAIARGLADQGGRAPGAPVLLRHLLGPLAHARLPPSRGATSTPSGSA